MVEDGLTQLLGLPGHRFVIWVDVVTATEHLVTVTGRVEEVDGLAVGQTVTSRADID